MDAIRSVGSWLEKSPYASALGARLEAQDEGGARLRLPFREENCNPGRALHGGCAASLAALGAHAVARAGGGDAAGPWHTCQLQVSYLAAAIGEDVVARAELLRRGKELCFAAIRIETDAGKPIAQAGAAVRGRGGAAPAELQPTTGGPEATDPGPLGPGFSKLPFVRGRGIAVELMRGGHSRLVMPFRAENTDAGGGVHEGALLALFDTTGSSAAWSLVGPGPHKASTPALQAQILAPPPEADLVGYGRCVQRDREIFWNEVEVATAGEGRVVARGSVLYRIVT